MAKLMRDRRLQIKRSYRSVRRELQIWIKNDIGFGNKTMSIVKDTGSGRRIFKTFWKQGEVLRRGRDRNKANAVALHPGWADILFCRGTLSDRYTSDLLPGGYAPIDRRKRVRPRGNVCGVRRYRR